MLNVPQTSHSNWTITDGKNILCILNTFQMIQSNQPLLNEAMAHIRDNIFQTSTTCLNILETQIVMRHDECILFVCILFSDAHFWTWAPTIIVSTLSSPLFKKHKYKIMLLVCLQNMELCILFGIFRSACLFVCSRCLRTQSAECAWMFYVFFILISYGFFSFIFCLCYVSCMSFLICCASTNFKSRIQVSICRHS